MKIERYTPEHLSVNTTIFKPPRLPDKAESPGRASGTDRADISVAGQSISYLVQQVLRHPETREKVVLELQAKIASGTYSVSDDQVTEAILSGLK